jgi:hypothetical protein
VLTSWKHVPERVHILLFQLPMKMSHESHQPEYTSHESRPNGHTKYEDSVKAGRREQLQGAHFVQVCAMNTNAGIPKILGVVSITMTFQQQPAKQARLGIEEE